MKHTVREIQLKNGASGLLIDVPGASVMRFTFNFIAGDLLSPEGKWDTAHLMEHLVCAANEQIKNGRAFSAEMQKNGAVTNAYTSPASVGYWAECADFEWQRILDLMMVQISKPIFLRTEFKAEFGNVKDELTAWTNNHFAHLNAEVLRAHQLEARSDRDRLKELKNIRRVDVIDHYKRTHTTSNLRFIVAGNLRGRQAAIERTIEKIALPKGRGRLKLPHETPHNVDAPIFVSRPSVKSCHFFIHTFAKGRLDQNSEDALHLVDSMLTGTLHSRIFGEARERGLVYHLGSGVANSIYNSSWHFEAQVLPRNLKALFEIIIREVQRVQAGYIAEQDLESAKMFELGRYQLGGQTVSGMTGFYAGRYFMLGEVADYDDIPNRIKSVNNAKIAKAVDAIFADDIGSLGMLGNKTSRHQAEGLFEMIQPLWNS